MVKHQPPVQVIGFMSKKAAFKGSTKTLADFDKFVLGVSMGSQNHTGEAFTATVDCINKTDLKRGILDVSDALRRYSINAQDSNAAHDEAADQGQEWVIENTEAIEKFRVPVNVEHWDTWLNDDRFNDYLAQFTRAYNNSDVLRDAIKADIENYFNRRGVAPDDTMTDASTRFYLEELAVMSIQFEDEPAAQIYAGKQLNCLKVVRDGLVPDVPKGIQNAGYFRLNIYDAPSND